MDLFEGLKEKISRKDIKVVFPEGVDARIIGAAVRLAADGLCHPIILGNKEVILASAQDLGFLMDKVEIIDQKHTQKTKKKQW